MVFPGNSRLNTIFFVISGKMVFIFPENMIFFLWAENERRWFLSKKCVEIWYFLYIWEGVTSTTFPSPPPPPGHKTKMPFPRKNTPKGDISGITEIDDIHPRKYSISAETPRWLTPLTGPKKQPLEMFYKKRCS